MIYKPFSVVTVPFPFADKSQTRKRPAVVLSNVEHQKQTHHVTLLMITSAKHSLWSSDIEIKDIEAAGLPAISVIRQKIFTIDSRLVIKHIGQLAQSDQIKLTRELKHYLSDFL